MGKKLKDDPLGLRSKLSSDTIVAEEEPVQDQETTDDPLGLRAKLKKKDLTVSAPSSEGGTTTPSALSSSSASEPQQQPSEKSGENITSTETEQGGAGLTEKILGNVFKGVYDLGRKAISVFTNEAPATAATEKAIEQPTDFIDDLIKKHPEKYAVTNEFASPETRRQYAEKIADKEFPGWRESKEVLTPEGKIIKTGGLYTQSATRKKEELLAEAEKQKGEGEKLTAGIPKTWEEAQAKGSEGITSYIGSAIGNGLGQIPLSAATLGTSSYLMEKSGAYDEAVDAIAKENGLTKEQVIKNGLDQPAKDIAHYVGLINGGIDLASSLFTVNKATAPLKEIVKKQANEQLLKNIPKELLKKGIKVAAAPLTEYATEFAQESMTQAGAQIAAGKKPEDITIDWNRSREAGLQGLFGSLGVVGAGKVLSPQQTIEEAKTKIQSTADQATIEQEAEKIVESVKQESKTTEAGTPVSSTNKPTPEEGVQNESNNELGTQTETGLGTEVQELGEQVITPEGNKEPSSLGSLNRSQSIWKEKISRIGEDRKEQSQFIDKNWDEFRSNLEYSKLLKIECE